MESVFAPVDILYVILRSTRFHLIQTTVIRIYTKLTSEFGKIFHDLFNGGTWTQVQYSLLYITHSLGLFDLLDILC